MPGDLLTNIRTAALGYAGLTSLLGGSTSDTFQLYDTQLRPASTLSRTVGAIVQTIVSNPRTYSFTARIRKSRARVQFDVWSIDPTLNAQIAQQLLAFLDATNFCGVSGLSLNPNTVVSDRGVNYPETQPPQYRRIIEALIYWDETL